MTVRVDARNAPSLRLAERLGMRREAYLVENEWLRGAWSDEINLALLEREWAAKHAAGADRGRSRAPSSLENLAGFLAR